IGEVLPPPLSPAEGQPAPPPPGSLAWPPLVSKGPGVENSCGAPPAGPPNTSSNARKRSPSNADCRQSPLSEVDVMEATVLSCCSCCRKMSWPAVLGNGGACGAT